MKLTVTAILQLALLLAAPLAAEAAITCTVTSSGWATAYVPSNPTTNITQSSFDVTCQRNAGGDPTTINFSVAVDNGIHRTGGQNRARLGATGNYINYENYRDGTCAAIWGAITSQRITGSMTLSGLTPSTVTLPFWGCVGAGQTGKPAGTYTDTVTMTLRNTATGTTLDTGTFPVSIYTPAVCNVTTAPGTVSFTYSAFQASPAVASTPFGVTCTNLLPYTMALDATVGVIQGLQYSISLSAAGATGNGLEQGHSVNGTMPAGQAGTCATGTCTPAVPNTHTVTITY